MGFEPTRAEHDGLAGHRLNHSATVSMLRKLEMRPDETTTPPPHWQQRGISASKKKNRTPCVFIWQCNLSQVRKLDARSFLKWNVFLLPEFMQGRVPCSGPMLKKRSTSVSHYSCCKKQHGNLDFYSFSNNDKRDSDLAKSVFTENASDLRKTRGEIHSRINESSWDASRNNQRDERGEEKTRWKEPGRSWPSK